MPEIGYNDGSYLTQKGNDLIAKLMASGEGLQFTRVSVGDGSIPSGSSPDSMTDLGHEVMDGMIASIANSNNGEVSIVAQVSSVGVETGFNATELGLWATDPDEGEILYTYLSLQEHPEWIRPDGDAVNKLATFTLVTIVSSVSIVTAIINPDAFATMADLANYALIGHGHEISDIAGLQEILDDYGDEIDLLSDLISGDMPGGITFSADFATLSNVTIIDGVWNQTCLLYTSERAAHRRRIEQHQLLEQLLPEPHPASAGERRPRHRRQPNGAGGGHVPAALQGDARGGVRHHEHQERLRIRR